MGYCLPAVLNLNLPEQTSDSPEVFGIFRRLCSETEVVLKKLRIKEKPYLQWTRRTSRFRNKALSTKAPAVPMKLLKDVPFVTIASSEAHLRANAAVFDSNWVLGEKDLEALNDWPELEGLARNPTLWGQC